MTSFVAGMKHPSRQSIRRDLAITSDYYFRLTNSYNVKPV